jgi:hypothetical protein
VSGESAVLGLLMRLVLTVTGLISLLIGIAIALRVLGANAHNGAAHTIHSAANFFAGSFTTLFSIDHARLSLVVNWGIAIGVYLIAGIIVASVIASLARVIVPSAPASDAKANG